MAKRGQRRLSKKGLFGLTKVREQGTFFEGENPATRRTKKFKLVWQYKGQKYETLRGVIVANWADMLHIQNPAKVEEA